MNPKEHPDYIATYSFECSVTHRIFHVTVRGPFLQAVREAEDLVVEQMLELAKREQPELTAESCRSRLRGLHSGIELGVVHVVDPWRGKVRSRVAR